MNIEDIEFEMSINEVKPEDIQSILEVCKVSGYGLETLDDELQKRGYAKLFTVDLDEVDEEAEWDDFE